ncbi:histidinol-phosphate transaminase [Suttonella sp. R2A3]|uniref:pyridoxal phosphate-dependent aminotransferase n=1 Tax=Suttonella sp. R2A3 TaxID=2908648 RepID=UPI0021A88305|nr:aminotransferase class I/II-fold pyridoxal phosphate-dependent enzyme [Suttonella sp. R2A3]
MLAAIEKEQPAVVFLADPNNPTGNALDAEAIRAIVAAAPGLVVLDEAYGPYSESSSAELLTEYDNLVVMRTLSKMGFAGLRFGYLFGPAAWMNEFAKVKPPYNVNVLTLASIDFALEHFTFTEAQTAMICRERERMFAEYQKLDGVKVWPSQANFLLMRVNDANAAQQALLARGIWVKSVSHVDPMLENCLRITISNAQENDRCLMALREALADG